MFNRKEKKISSVLKRIKSNNLNFKDLYSI